MAFICKNCGGNITLDASTNTIICDSCGVQQSLSDVLSNEAENLIYKEDELSKSSILTYKRAVSLMVAARTESSFAFAAGIFEEIPGVFNSDYLAKECHEKAELFRSERIYQAAIMDMQSDDPSIIKKAITAFESLGTYKDCQTKSDECLPLLDVAQKNYQEKLRIAQEQKILEEQQRQETARKRKDIYKIIALFAILLTVFSIIRYFSMYSSSKIKISLSPRADNFISETYNHYVFTYDVEIKNTGTLDVNALEGMVIFEQDNEILIDTNISFYNYSTAVVRAKKSCQYTWELTVYSDNVALALYETDFDDIDVKIEITSITYANGKTKTY